MTHAVPSESMARSGTLKGGASIAPVRDSARESSDHEARHARAVLRGSMLGLAITVPLAVAASGVAFLTGHQERTIVVALGLAAGASMATQVTTRCHRAGVAATFVAVVSMALAVLGMHVGVLAAQPGPWLPEVMAHANLAGLGDIVGEYVRDQPSRAVASIVAGVVFAYLAGRGLGECRLEQRLSRLLGSR
ncbi:hypothetical protein [Demequina capsici]|uniref:Uncharacterized protein n=1 Tax=Demequina capsici TaxID=3075620 RepID=A0AA96F5Y8_9MICO|nr:hypothetical protein [Demequina sp. OYTSA14]WNM23944.1 hypothetical protein RN606_11335 [Demequina sp. OYTSA14]